MLKAEQFLLGLLVALALSATSAHATYPTMFTCYGGCSSQCGCEPSYAPGSLAAEDGSIPSAVADSYLSAGESVASAPVSYAPNMIGDSINFPATSIAAGDRRSKIADNNSVVPKNRVFFNYNHYHNGVQGASPVTTDLDRFVFGVESTILRDYFSVELRIPFAAGLDRNQVDGLTLAGTEFGNMSLTFKTLVWETCTTAVSAGLGLGMPTAADASLLPAGGGAPLYTVDNEAWYLQPFLGALYAPNERWWLQSFMQWDFAGQGYDVTDGVTSGKFQEQNLMYVDVQFGVWLYHDHCARYVTGVAPVVELHYTTTMNDTDSVLGVANNFNRVDVLNITGGLHFELGPSTMATIAGVAPLRDGDDALFDSEIAFQINRWF